MRDAPATAVLYRVLPLLLKWFRRMVAFIDWKLGNVETCNFLCIVVTIKLPVSENLLMYILGNEIH
jgi:hypothetical protein